MLDGIYRLITSLKLTVVLLALGLVLVFWGTLAQVKLGLYQAQAEFFRSFFIYWNPDGLGLRLPIFPGGYLIGGLLLINLFAAHFRYYQPGGRKIGIAFIHLGIVLLLIGQVLTDVLSVESSLHLRHGDTKSYSEAVGRYELAIIDTTDEASDQVVAVPASLLLQQRDIRHAAMPFTVSIPTFHPNSALAEKAEAGYHQVNSTAGIGAEFWWRPLAQETALNRIDVPSGLVEIVTPQGSLGRYLVSAYLTGPQMFSYGGRQYEMQLRPERFYKPYSLHLLEFRHDTYPGTEIPKNFSSRVRLEHPAAGENREVLISMNNPLRYDGETYYQSSYDRDNQGTILQVVRNPSWLTPYLACILVGIGMTIQFGVHLYRFAKRKAP